MRHISISILAIAAMAVGLGSQRFSCFPRMSLQPSIKPFERAMPEQPERVVSFAAPPEFPRTVQAAARVPNPVPRNAQAVNLGRIYYGYYCRTCHGPFEGEQGGVGPSYVPAPTDLSSARVQAMPDGELCLRMIVGAGHQGMRGEPVLESTVPLERRWHIVHYLRTLAGSQPEAAPMHMEHMGR